MLQQTKLRPIVLFGYRDTYDYPSINIDNLGGTPDASFENTN